MKKFLFKRVSFVKYNCIKRWPTATPKSIVKMESNGNVTVISFSQQDNQGKDQFSAINNNQEISSTKDQKKRRKRKRAKIRKHFALTTTCGGLAQLYINKNKWVRLIWTLVILALVGLLVWEVS